ncbi:MAG: 8-oxoguanine DNA glycosylase [Clostridiales bacterium]|nr:8-oxoguanine DNA glycosylase [Clostridiales bacterium]
MTVYRNVKNFNLDHIFDCGQCFRWEKQGDGSYTGIAAGAQPVNISFRPCSGDECMGELAIDNAGDSDFAEFWSSYLDLGRDYEAIIAELSKNDPVMAKAAEFGRGIRILQQDKWETLISFIISQNNNIKRIKGCISSLCENFGKPAGEYRGRTFFKFPDTATLAGLSEEDLAPCRLGYRAKYIVKTAKAVNKDNCEMLLSLGGASDEEAFKYLTGLPGVGPKVARCIMLFSMDKHGSFPIDVWVKHAMSSLYGIDESNTKAMAEYAGKNFGRHGGIAQQYLFYYMKSLEIRGKK